MAKSKRIKKLAHPYLNHGDDEKEAVRDLYIKKKLTPAEYVNLRSGAYGHSWYNIPDSLGNHPLNNEKNNSKALKRLADHYAATEGQDSDETAQLNEPSNDDTGKMMEKIIEDHPISKDDINKIIDNPSDYGLNGKEIEQLKNQPNLDKEHLLRIASNPNLSMGNLLRHKAVDKDVVNAVLSDPRRLKRMSSGQVEDLVSTMSHGDESKRLLSPQDAASILQNSNYVGDKDERNPRDSHVFDRVAQHVEPSKRKEIIDDILGIRGGKHRRNDPEDVENPDHLSYDNWEHGDNYDSKKAVAAAGSAHLTPSQIDHIKRHGNIDEKYALFHNKDIDPRHAAEMYGHWLNDDTDKEYHQDELKEKIKEHNPFEYEDYYEEAGDQARDDYPFEEYLQAIGEQEAPIDSTERDRQYEGYDESLQEATNDKAHDLYENAMDTAHENPDFLPKHLPQVEEIKAKRRAKQEEEARVKAEHEAKQNKEFLDQQVPNRSEVHPYGDLQHHVQMAQGYANSNGGSIDIGSLNKLHPNMKDKWKAIFGGKGKLSSQELDQKLQDLPKTPYAVSHRKWDPGLQNINEQPQVVYRLDHTPESIAPMKADPETHRIFNKIADVSQRSGHPTNANTIGWARVDTNNPKHWMIDEVQSDFGSAARDYLEENGKPEEAESVNKILAHHKNWREALVNHVLNEAKKHGVEKVSTHSPESKSAHTGSDRVHSVYFDSYQKIPRSMGFRPSPMGELPLNEKGQRAFLTSQGGTPTEQLIQDHESGMNEHARQWLHHTREQESPGEMGDALRDAHGALAEHHSKMFKEHQARLSQLDPSHVARKMKTPQMQVKRDMNYHENQPDWKADSKTADKHAAMMASGDMKVSPVYGFDSSLKQEPAKVVGHPGHTYDLNPQVVKKSLDEVADLMKVENIDVEIKQKIASTLHMLQENEAVLQQIGQSNPEVYNAVRELVQSMVDMAKKTTGRDPNEDVHKLQIQSELEQQQPQEEPQGQPQGSPGAPAKDEPIHGRKKVYPIGAMRQYNSQDARIKDQNGEWHSYGGGLKDPSEGQSNG